VPQPTARTPVLRKNPHRSRVEYLQSFPSAPRPMEVQDDSMLEDSMLDDSMTRKISVSLAGSESSREFHLARNTNGRPNAGPCASPTTPVAKRRKNAARRRTPNHTPPTGWKYHPLQKAQRVAAGKANQRRMRQWNSSFAKIARPRCGAPPTKQQSYFKYVDGLYKQSHTPIYEYN